MMSDNLTENQDVPMTLMAHQVELERLYSKNQLIPRIKKEFLESPIEFEAHFTKKDIPVDFGYSFLVQMCLHKRAKLETIIGILHHHFDNLQDCADAILKACQADLADWSPTTREIIVRPEFTITGDVQEEIDRYQFPLPMVIKPLTITSNTDNGYVTSKCSVILRDNHHQDDVCLDHLNRMNAVRFTINNGVATMVKNKWRNLDKPKVGETRNDFNRRKKAFEKYDRTAKQVIAKIQEHGPDFYLTHRYDKRGRTYCQGYHVNYQGAPWNKAVVELADKEIIQ